MKLAHKRTDQVKKKCHQETEIHYKGLCEYIFECFMALLVKKVSFL